MAKTARMQNILEIITGPPLFKPSQQHAGLLAYRLSKAGLGMCLFAMLVPLVSGSAGLPFLVGIAVVALLHVITLAMLYNKQVVTANYFLPTSLFIGSALADIFVSNQALSSFGGYIAATILASQLLGDIGGKTFFVLSMLSSISAYLFEVFTGTSMIYIGGNHAAAWFVDIAFFLWIGQMLFIANQNLNNMVAQTKKDQIDLERRFVQLQVAAEVARDAAALHETELLMNRSVDIVRNRFGFDHAGIYLVDETRQYAVLRAATGKIGRQLVTRGHKLKIGETGMVGYVTATGHHRVSGDVGQDPVHIKNPELANTRSELTLPLKAGQIIIGALDVQSNQKNAFDEDDVTVLQTMADQLAVAIENARLFEATSRQLDELIALHGVSMATASAVSEDDLITQTTKLISETLFPDIFGVLLLNKKVVTTPPAERPFGSLPIERTEYFLTFHPSYITIPGFDFRPIPLGQGVIGTVAATGQTMRVPDVSKESSYYAVDARIRSELCVPIKIGSEVVGVLNSESRVIDDFDAQDERLMETIASQLATAIQKIRAFEAERRRAAELEGLRQASLQVSSTLDLRQVLAAIIESAVKLTGAYSSHIYLYESGRLNFGMAVWADGVQREVFDRPKPGGMTTQVAETGRMIAIPDVRRSSIYKGREWDGAILGLPLINQGKVLGVMNLSWTSGPHEFDQNELRVLRLLADQAALALANAYLYTEAQERALELSEALSQREELVRLKNEFIQNVSHELRTPLAIARGYTDLMEKDEFGVLNIEQRDAVNILSRRINMLIKLVDDLVTILEAEALEVKHEQVNLAEMVERVVKDFAPAAAEKNLKLTAQINWPSNSTPPVVRGTGSHLNRLLDNLVGNAIKFTPPDRSITILLHREGMLAALEVIDEGIGIPADKLGRIFERFYQVDGSSKRRFGGTGLGLALVKEITESHNGHVSVQSEEGKGSTFTVILPLLAP